MAEMTPNNPFTQRFAERMKVREAATQSLYIREISNGLSKPENTEVIFGYSGVDNNKREAVLKGVFGDRISFSTVEEAKANITPGSNLGANAKEKTKAELDIVTKSVFLSMNLACVGDKGLITDSMSPAQIDSVLPESLKGIGTEIKKLNLSTEAKKTIAFLSKTSTENGCYLPDATQESKQSFFDTLQTARQTLQEGSPERFFVNLCEDVLRDQGYEEEKIVHTVNVGVEKNQEVGVSSMKSDEILKLEKQLQEDKSRLDGLTGSERDELNSEIERRKELVKQLKFSLGIREIAKNRDREADSFMGIDQIYENMEFIEANSFDASDLTRNANRYRLVYKAQMGDFDEALLGSVYKDQIMTKDLVERFKTEISMRMFLHSFNSAASKCKSIEDILRVVTTMHEDDRYNNFDRTLVSTLLDSKGCGLSNIPVNKAWDLRQKGYFLVEQLFDDVIKNEKFFAHLKNETTIIKDQGWSDLRGVLEITPCIPKDERYGIDNPVSLNYFSIEKGSKIETPILKEYMIWMLEDGGKVDRKNAEKAYELAQKLSVSTFSDSKANIVFAGDDYSELILFKFLRYSDGPNGSAGRDGKSKAIGAAETIKHLDSLTCHWLDLAINDKKKAWRGVYSPLFSEDIDFNKINSIANMKYHFPGVVASQVLTIQEAFYKKISPKDVNELNFLNSLHAKILKTTSDMCRAGIMPVRYVDEDKRRTRYPKEYFDLKVTDPKRGQIETVLVDTVKKIWLQNLCHLIGNDASGWSVSEFRALEKRLYRDPMMYDQNKNPGASFIPISEILDVFKRTRVIVEVNNNEAEAERRKRRLRY